MFSKALADSIRQHHREFAERMRRDRLKPIGFLGGRKNEPEIIDYVLVEQDPKGHRTLKLRIRFPKHVNANTLKREETVVHVIPFSFLDIYESPADGAAFTQVVGEQLFTGKVRHEGDFYVIDFTVSAPFDADKIIC